MAPRLGGERPKRSSEVQQQRSNKHHFLQCKAVNHARRITGSIVEEKRRAPHKSCSSVFCFFWSFITRPCFLREEPMASKSYHFMVARAAQRMVREVVFW